MKRIVFAIVIMTLGLSVSGQKSVEDLFEKYSGSAGFTSITINGNLLDLARAFDNDDSDNLLPGDISVIRILVQEDRGVADGNFFKMVERGLDRKDYEEFMRVKESDSDLIMLVRSQGRSFTEFLVIAGNDNGEDNVLIQIKGNMTYREAREFADRIKRDHGAEIIISCR